MAREDREKLTDQLAKGEPLFARRVNSFEEAYPAIKSLRVEVTETRGQVEVLRITSFTEENFRDAVNCSNPRCYGGGAFLGLHINYMAEDRELEKQITERCRGYEGSPKGRRRYGPCPNNFRISVRAEYWDDPPSGG